MGGTGGLSSCQPSQLLSGFEDRRESRQGWHLVSGGPLLFCCWVGETADFFKHLKGLGTFCLSVYLHKAEHTPTQRARSSAPVSERHGPKPGALALALRANGRRREPTAGGEPAGAPEAGVHAPLPAPALLPHSLRGLPESSGLGATPASGSMKLSREEPLPGRSPPPHEDGDSDTRGERRPGLAPGLCWCRAGAGLPGQVLSPRPSAAPWGRGWGEPAQAAAPLAWHASGCRCSELQGKLFWKKTGRIRVPGCRLTCPSRACGRTASRGARALWRPPATARSSSSSRAGVSAGDAGAGTQCRPRLLGGSAR